MEECAASSHVFRREQMHRLLLHTFNLYLAKGSGEEGVVHIPPRGVAPQPQQPFLDQRIQILGRHVGGPPACFACSRASCTGPMPCVLTPIWSSSPIQPPPVHRTDYTCRTARCQSQAMPLPQFPSPPPLVSRSLLLPCSSALPLTQSPANTPPPAAPPAAPRCTSPPPAAPKGDKVTRRPGDKVNNSLLPSLMIGVGHRFGH